MPLDTHALLWWFADDPALPYGTGASIDDPDNTVFISAASAWEICTKVRIGKLPTGRPLCSDFGTYLERFYFTPLPVSVEHGRLAGSLRGAHKDPFDRMLAAQALMEDVPLVTDDSTCGLWREGDGVAPVGGGSDPSPR